jgi:hypothetical protein
VKQTIYNSFTIVDGEPNQPSLGEAPMLVYQVTSKDGGMLTIIQPGRGQASFRIHIEALKEMYYGSFYGRLSAPMVVPELKLEEVLEVLKPEPTTAPKNDAEEPPPDAVFKAPEGA